MNKLKRLLYEGQFLRIWRDGNWEYVERIRSRAVVVIVGVTPGNELLLVEQYRIPTGKNVLELPAGLVGDVISGETLEDAAAREFEEETGYHAERLEYCLEGPSSAGLTNETMVFFRAEGLEKVGDGGGDETEDIVVHRVDLASAASWLNKKSSDYLIDPKIYTGLWILAERRD